MQINWFTLSAEFLSEGYYPVYNPLEHTFNNLPPLEKEKQIGNRAEQLLDAFEVMIGDEFSAAMRLMVKYCLRLLMAQQQATLGDFLDMVNPENAEQYAELAAGHSNKRLRTYFAEVFTNDRLRGTKLAVYTRLEAAFSNPALSKILTEHHESSFDLKKLALTGKSGNLQPFSGRTFHRGSKGAWSLSYSRADQLCFQPETR